MDGIHTCNFLFILFHNKFYYSLSFSINFSLCFEFIGAPSGSRIISSEARHATRVGQHCFKVTWQNVVRLNVTDRKARTKCHQTYCHEQNGMDKMARKKCSYTVMNSNYIFIFFIVILMKWSGNIDVLKLAMSPKQTALLILTCFLKFKLTTGVLCCVIPAVAHVQIWL